MPEEDRLAEAETEARFADYRAIFDASPDGIVVVDASGTVVEVNPKALAMLGYEREEMLGASVEQVVPPSVRGRHVDLRERYMERPVARPMGADLDLRAARKDGREFPVEVALRPITTPEGRFVISVMRDTSRQRRLETLGTGSLRATEEERQRIARELHDDTAQTLAALMIRLRVLARTPDEEARARIHDELHESLEAAVEGIRRIARGLRPPALEDVGVEAAVRAHLRRTFEGTGIEVETELDAVDDRLDAEGQLVVYRVVQEALSNVMRHARAGRVRVRLGVEHEGTHAHVVAEVEDDGTGFDAEGAFLQGRGLGLVGMDERARIAGGRLTMASAPGEGCLVRLRIPVPILTSASP
jgi:PAS domain S-box-containing protein